MTMVFNIILRNLTSKFLSPIVHCKQTRIPKLNLSAGFSTSSIKKDEFKELLDNSSLITSSTEKDEFKELLDNSPLIKFGRCDGRDVIAKIVETCNDDLYMDFGGKFEYVCTRPEGDTHDYQVGDLVKIRLDTYEMTGAFLGDKRHVTICEADGLLLGPYSI